MESYSSSNVVDYSIRHNKAIERSLVFEGLSSLRAQGLFERPIYVGFGSIWFSDFDMAHRLLGIEDMFSIEADHITYSRALFNRLYRTLRVVEGFSGERLPELLAEPELTDRSWIVWLDYDKELDEGRLDELRVLVATLPRNSVLLTTFSALSRRYAQKSELRQRLAQLFERDVVPPHVSNRELASDAYLSRLLAREALATLVSSGLVAGRSGGCLEAFRVTYRDSVPMVTIGVGLPSAHSASRWHEVVGDEGWPGFDEDLIQIPPLTAKEVQALRSVLPNDAPLTKEAVQQLGFDLELDQIESFCKHYLRYPTYAQVL